MSAGKGKELMVETFQQQGDNHKTQTKKGRLLEIKFEIKKI